MAGFFDEPKAPTPMSTPYFSVTCETEGVNYKYSLDDSEPSQVSADLNESGQFQLISGTPTTIRIRAYKEGYEPSDIATKTYTPVTVPMALPDGSVLFYDRGTSYGEYCIGDNRYPVRIDGETDDGSAESSNWRYLICDKSDLEGTKEWGPDGILAGVTNRTIGYGFPNTEPMVGKYGDNDAYFWKYIKEKRDYTSFNWFMPSNDELYMVFQNRDIITQNGGLSFQSSCYWSSCEYNSGRAYAMDFSNGFPNYYFKTRTYHCRLLRRI